MEEICRFELGRWSATVKKVEPGTFERMPDATLGVDLRCDGVQFEWYPHWVPPRTISPEPIDEDILKDIYRYVQKWVDSQGLRTMKHWEARLLGEVEMYARDLCEHIEQGGTVDEYCKELQIATRPRTQSL